jgi:drug/metabolite transporter (DMT)-like permease
MPIFSPHLYAIFAFLFGALMNLGVKALDGAVPISLVLTFRFWVGFWMIYPLARRERGFYYMLKTQRVKMHMIRAISGLVTVGVFFYALPLLPLGDASALGQVYPFFLMLLSVPVLGEKIPAKQYAVCLVGLAGVLLIAQPHGTAGLWPTLLVVFGSIMAALTDLLVRGLAKTERSLTTVLWFFMLAGFVSFAWYLIADRGFQLSYSQFGILILVGLAGGLTQFALAESFKYLKADVMSAYSYMGLFFAVLFGFIFFAEVPTIGMLVGAGLILSAAHWSYKISQTP